LPTGVSWSPSMKSSAGGMPRGHPRLPSPPDILDYEIEPSGGGVTFVFNCTIGKDKTLTTSEGACQRLRERRPMPRKLGVGARIKRRYYVEFYARSASRRNRR
jgi:hypothetical protein